MASRNFWGIFGEKFRVPNPDSLEGILDFHTKIDS